MTNKTALVICGLCIYSSLAWSANSDSADALILGPQPVPVNQYLATTPSNINYDLYAGLTFGANAGMIKRDLKYLTFNCPQHETDNYSPYGVEGGMFLGGGLIMATHFYLGAEFFATFSSTEKNIDHGDYYFKQRQNHVLGVDFTPGYKINNSVLLYGKIGVGHTNFKFSTNNSVEFRTNNWSQAKLGTRLGLGIEGFFARHCSLAAEYVFTNYGSKSDDFVDTSMQPYTTYRNNYHLYTNEFAIKFAYHFV